ncbi:hypothetical protein [Reyranella sp. CPCC 100927]|uniref:hypothetical protein n=1 Tax=Reyranella sp. CPCC 100927 TaxID=2599616 RepID=UPI0015B75FAD|nr:hypothetical protein [Reyranella sp. CPCC 100927]
MDDNPTISTSSALQRAWTNAMWPIGMILEGEHPSTAEPCSATTRTSDASSNVRLWHNAPKIVVRAPKARDAST